MKRPVGRGYAQNARGQALTLGVEPERPFNRGDAFAQIERCLDLSPGEEQGPGLPSHPGDRTRAGAGPHVVTRCWHHR